MSSRGGSAFLSNGKLTNKNQSDLHECPHVSCIQDEDASSAGFHAYLGILENQLQFEKRFADAIECDKRVDFVVTIGESSAIATRHRYASEGCECQRNRTDPQVKLGRTLRFAIVELGFGLYSGDFVTIVGRDGVDEFRLECCDSENVSSGFGV